MSPMRPCLGTPDQTCTRLTTRSDSRCEACARTMGQARDARRGSRQDRGYARPHERLRENWRPQVERGEVDCARCAQRILPGQAWALDHTDDRTGYLGPSHATCNNSAGGQAASQT